MKTRFILRVGARAFTIVTTSDERNQTIAPLEHALWPAHTRYETGTSDETILSLARRAGIRTWTSIAALSAEYGLTENEMLDARQLGREIEKSAQSAA